MIKKTIYLAGLVMAFLLAACTSEVDDIFGGNSSDRIAERLAADKAVLTGAANGWLMEYFPAKSLSYGGYNVLVKFGEGEDVTVASEIGETSQTVTSTYSLKEQAGPVLTFDTYNSLFHPFSDPKNDYGMGEVGLGMEGDYEFIIMEATAEKVELKGKKTGNRIVMTPMPADSDWTSYMEKIKASAENVEKYFTYSYAITGIDFEVDRRYRTLNITMQNEEGDNETTVHAYIPTTNGFKLYEAADFFGVRAREFKETGNGQWASADGMVKVKGNAPSNADVFMNYGPWFLTYENMTGTATKNTFEENYEKMFGDEGVFPNLSLQYFGFGSNLAFTNDGLQLISSEWNPNMSDADYVANVAMVEVTRVRVPGSDNMVSLYFNKNTAYGTKKGAEMMDTGIVSFMVDKKKTKMFRLQAADVFRPTQIVLTDVEDPANKFTLLLKPSKFGYPADGE